METISVDNLLDKIDTIPSLPKVVGRVLEMVKDTNVALSDLEKVISTDIAFSSSILKVVNSAFYNLQSRVTTIGKALSLLGFNMLKSAIIGVSIIKTYKGKNFNPNAGSLLDEEKKFSPEGLWAHSLGVASCARVIAKKIVPKQTEELFIGGIIHDIGKLIVQQYFHEIFEYIIDIVQNDEILYFHAEKKVVNLSHVEIGYRLTKKWNLPENLSNIVKYHHNPEEAPEEGRELVDIIHIADIIARSLQIGSGWDDQIPEINNISFQRLGFTVDDVDWLMKDCMIEYKSANIFQEAIGE